MTTVVIPHCADWARPLYEQQIALTGELAESAMEITRALKERIISATDADPAPLVMAYGRAARAVRMSLMLQARLIKELEARDAHKASLSASAARDQRRERQAQIERIVERVAVEQGEDTGEVERLVFEAGERLERDDIYGRLLDRPVSELVVLICRDLGLDPDWAQLAQEAWAQTEAAGAAPGWPLAGLAAGTGSPHPATSIGDRFKPSG